MIRIPAPVREGEKVWDPLAGLVQLLLEVLLGRRLLLSQLLLH